MANYSQVLKKISISRGYLLFALALCFVLFSLFGQSSHIIVVALTVAVVIYSFPFMSIFPKIMTLIMFGVGHYLFFSHAVDGRYWQEAMIKNLPLITLYVSVPLFLYPLRNGEYIQFIAELVRRFIRTPFSLSVNIIVGTFLLSSFMNIGSVRIIFELFKSHIKKRELLYMRALAQGFSLSMCWSPYIAGVAIIINFLHLSLFPFLLWGLLLAVTGAFTSIALILKEARSIGAEHNQEIAAASAKSITSLPKRKGIELVSVFIGIFLTLTILDSILSLNIVMIVSIVAFIFPIVWSMLIKKVKVFFRSLGDYKNNVLPRLHNEVILFIAAAFFAEMVKLTSVPEKLTALYSLASQWAPIFIILLTIFIVVLPAVFGIHQVLPVSILATSISVTSIPISIEAFGLAMAVGWSLSAIISPTTGVNLTLSSLVNKPPYVICFWNVKYVIAAFFTFSFVIYLIHLLTF